MEEQDIANAQGSTGNAISHFAEFYDHYKEKFAKETVLFHEESQKQKETVSSPDKLSQFGGMPDPDDPDKDKQKRKHKRNKTQWKNLFKSGKAYKMAIEMTEKVLGPASTLKLKEAIEKFKNTPGFNSIIRRIIEAFESAKYGKPSKEVIEKFKNTSWLNSIPRRVMELFGSAKPDNNLSRAAGNIRGALWEVKVALKLEKTGSSVIEFAKKINNRDFDIITKLKAIECKSWNWAKISIDKIRELNGSLCSLRDIANEEGLAFEFWSEHPIVKPLKELLNKNQITYK